MLEAGCHTMFLQKISTKEAIQHKKLSSRMWSRGLKWSWVGYFLLCKTHQRSVSIIGKCKWDKSYFDVAHF